MSSVSAFKYAVVSGTAGVALLVGGLLFGGAIVGAQTPPAETPAAPTETVPAAPSQRPDMTPGDDGMRPERDGECPKDKMGDASGESGAGFRGRGGPRGAGAASGSFAF